MKKLYIVEIHFLNKIAQEKREGEYGWVYFDDFFDKIALLKGWEKHNIFKNIIEFCNMHISYEKIFFYNKKINYRRIPIKYFDNRQIEDYLNKYLTDICYDHKKAYFYKKENGEKDFAVVNFYNNFSSFMRLPLTAWGKLVSHDTEIVLDILHPKPPYQLYNIVAIEKNKKHNNHKIVICRNEIFSDIFTQKRYIGTTCTDIHNANWFKIRGFEVYIFVNIFNEENFNYIFKLSKIFKDNKIEFKIIKIEKEIVTEDELNNFIDSISVISYTTPCSVYICEDAQMTLIEFAQLCLKKYKITIPPGIFPKAISIADASEESSEPEFLLDNLLRLGDQISIYASRGSGKSFFALFLAICFASGMTSMSGKICPCKKYNILLIDSEISLYDLKTRANRICKGLNIDINSLKNLKIRSSLHERTNLSLETNEGWNDLYLDLKQANIVIIDSLFRIFPSAMSNDFSGTNKINEFYSWCKSRNKTAIMIDHKGKTSNSPFGSIGKDISLDVVLQIESDKNNYKKFEIMKSRNFPSPSTKYWLKYEQIENDNTTIIFKETLEKNNNVKKISENYHAVDKGKSEVTHYNTKDNTLTNIDEDSDTGSTTDTAYETVSSNRGMKKHRAEAIIAYIEAHPDQAQGEICKAIEAKGNYGKRSSIQAAIKELYEAEKLSFWRNPPKPRKHSIQEIGEK